MKTYKQLMEVMSMKDMNKITGGTEAQRKIAQDRQRAREAKNKGFDSSKSPLADGGKKSSGLQKNDAKTELPTSAITKKGGALEKHRKSEMGKWSQGIKNSPGKLAKKAGGALAKKASSALVKRDDIKNVDVKDVTPKKVEDEKQAIGKRSAPKSDMADKQRARINKNSAMVKGKKKNNTNRIGKAIKGIGSAARKAAALADANPGTGSAEEGNLAGNIQRSKGVLS